MRRLQAPGPPCRSSRQVAIFAPIRLSPYLPFHALYQLFTQHPPLLWVLQCVKVLPPSCSVESGRAVVWRSSRQVAVSGAWVALSCNPG